MGEIADGLINGDFDFYTGEYIGRGYGIPRTHDRSLPWEKRKKKGLRSNPVLHYLSKKGIVASVEIRSVLLAYHHYKKWDFINQNWVDIICKEIQKDFQDFACWLGQWRKQKCMPNV